jgi:hypothetical protein
MVEPEPLSKPVEKKPPGKRQKGISIQVFLKNIGCCVKIGIMLLIPVGLPLLWWILPSQHLGLLPPDESVSLLPPDESAPPPRQRDGLKEPAIGPLVPRSYQGHLIDAATVASITGNMASPFGTGCISAAIAVVARTDEATRKVTLLVSRYLLGAGVERYWTPNGTRLEDPLMFEAKLRKLAVALDQVHPLYSIEGRRLLSEFRMDTPLEEYKRMARRTVHRIEKLETQAIPRTDEMGHRVTEFEKRIASREAE